MTTGLRKMEKVTLYDDDDNPVKATLLYVMQPGNPPVLHFDSGVTSFGRKITPTGTGTYVTDAGTILRTQSRHG